MKRGFTLIELLVVIAIIGVLASVVLVSLNGAREKSRHSATLATIAQVQKALELYYHDNNKMYPTFSNTTCGQPTWACIGDYSDGQCWNNNNMCESAEFVTALAPYLQVDAINLDFDPAYGGAAYRPLGSPVGSSYTIYFGLEGVGTSCGKWENNGTLNGATDFERCYVYSP